MKLLLGAVCAALFLSSCMSLQEQQPLAPFSGGEEAGDFEERLVVFEAASLNGTPPAAGDMNLLMQEIEAARASLRGNSSALARLSAFQGRLSLLQGRQARAEAYYREARGFDASDIHSLTLSIRLEKNAAERLALCESLEASLGMNGYVQLEKAIALYLLRDYGTSSAVFDAAFSILPVYYRDTYTPVRNRAWNLRTGTADLYENETLATHITSGRLSLVGMLLITQAETSLLAPFGGGGRLSRRDLLDEARRWNLVDAATLAAGGDAPVSRAVCAQYIWRLYTERRSLTTDYAELYRRARMSESPIADVPLDSPAFNAVAGCVENELINLSDGVHFHPDDPVSGAEFLRWIQRAAR